MPVHVAVTFIRLRHSRQHVQHRRLAGTVVAQQHRDLAFFHPPVQVVHRHELLTATRVLLAQPVKRHNVVRVIRRLEHAVLRAAVRATLEPFVLRPAPPSNRVQDEEQRVLRCAPLLRHHRVQVQHQQVVNEEVRRQHAEDHRHRRVVQFAAYLRPAHSTA
ncbi:hypothetical protein N2W54_003357 [Lotmaria passim]